MNTFLNALSNIVRDRSLRAIGIVEFLGIFAIGIFLNGCAASVQNVETVPAVLETKADDGTVTRIETLSDGTVAISTMKDGTDRPNHDITPTSLATKHVNQSKFHSGSLNGKLVSKTVTIGK